MFTAYLTYLTYLTALLKKKDFYSPCSAQERKKTFWNMVEKKKPM